VILDGLRLSEADISGTRLSGIPVNQVERIEVLRGSGAVLYGEGATSGVIVITTRGGARRAQRAQAYAAAGSHDTWELRADGSLPLDDAFALDLAASHRQSDNHRDNFRSKSGAGSVGLQWQQDGLRLGARYAHDELRTGLPGSLTAAQYAQNPRQTTTPTDAASIRNDRLTVSAGAALAGWQLAFDAGWREKALDSIFFGGRTAYEVKSDNQALRAQRSFGQGGLQHTITAGADSAGWQRRYEDAGRARQRSNALYLQDALAASSGTRVTVGARSEWIHKSLDDDPARTDSRQTAWELGLTQAFGAQWSLFGRLGRSYRLPNADEFSFTSPNASLQPQTSRDLEAGLRWSGEDTRAELRAYRNALRHEIGFDDLLFTNVNFDPTRRQGLELEADTKLTATVGARLNAALRQARFTEGPHDGQRVPLVPKASAALNVDWRFAPQQRLDAGVRYVGTQHPDFANQCTMPSYTTLDARYSVQRGSLELALKVDNLTDKRYYTQAFGCAGGVTTSIYPEAGRTVMASLRWAYE